MEARAVFRETRVPAGRAGVLVLALVAAFLVGGGGGYLVRGLGSEPTTPAHQPFVVEQAPYSTSLPAPAAEPTRDPKGFAVPI